MLLIFKMENVEMLSKEPNLIIDKFSLTHFKPVFHFYTSWKRQKIFSFATN